MNVLKIAAACVMAHYLIIACTSPTGDVVGPGAGGGLPNAMAADLYQSGSRLKVRIISGADGSQQFEGWQDTQTNEQCSFATVGANLYCLPSYATTGTYWVTGCTEPLTADARHATIIVDDGNVYRVGPSYTGDVYTTDANGGCYLADSHPAVWRRGQLVPLDSYVKGEQQVQQ